MRAILIIAAFGLVGWTAYAQGHRIGRESSPQYVAEERRYNDAVLDIIRATPVEDSICEQILDLARQYVDEESLTPPD